MVATHSATKRPSALPVVRSTEPHHSPTGSSSGTAATTPRGRKGGGHRAQREDDQGPQCGGHTRAVAMIPATERGVPGAGASRAVLHVTVREGLGEGEARRTRRRSGSVAAPSGRREREPAESRPERSAAASATPGDRPGACGWEVG